MTLMICMMKQPTVQEVEATDAACLFVLEKLIEFEPFVYSESASRVSVYIHFANLPNGMTHKLRISNHNERSRYGYKWQIRTDGLDRIERKRWSRYFDNPESFVKAFRSYYARVEGEGLPCFGERYDSRS
jgi:hypothetical protein